MNDFFCALQPSDWINFVGIILGALIGTIGAGLLSIYVSKKEWKKRFLLNNENLRLLITINKTSFKRVHDYTNGIIKGIDNSSDEGIIIRDLDNHIQIIIDNFNPKGMPADCFDKFKMINMSVIQIRNMIRTKDLIINGDLAYDPEELDTLRKAFKEAYTKVFKQLEVQI